MFTKGKAQSLKQHIMTLLIDYFRNARGITGCQLERNS